MFQLILVGISLLGVTQVQSDDHAELVTSEQAPWVASIMIEEGAGWRHVCTGTLVKANKVVTAAGCFDEWPAKTYRVMLGCTDRSRSHVWRQDVDVYTVVKHPKYINNDDKINNLAVATLASSADLTGSHVAVLPIKPVSPVDGDECHIYAWPTPSETDTKMIPNLNFHKMSKVSGSRGADSRKKRSTHKLNDSIKQRAHTRFTTHLTPHTPHTNNIGANMHNGSLLNVHRRRLRQLASNTDCHEKFQQFEGHTACLEKDANTVSVPFDGVMKELVVDLHNEYRAQVTPPATNMLQMSWDDELAMVAQRWADRCPDDHDDLNFIPGRFGVGQNLFWAWTYGGGDIEADLGWAIEEWFIEHHDYDYNKPHYDQTQDQNKPTGHYSQLAWSSTYKVGCAIAWCDQTKTMYIVVCNYGPQGNMMDQEKPYETGAQRCSQCKTCVEGLCDCGGKECGFGKLNPTTCECEDCPSHGNHYAGQNCELTCSKEGSDSNPCGVKKNWEKSDCDIWYQARDCPYLCGVCPYSDPNYNNTGGGGGSGGGSVILSELTNYSDMEDIERIVNQAVTNLQAATADMTGVSAEMVRAIESMNSATTEMRNFVRNNTGGGGGSDGVDGSWGSWNGWTDCSVTCETGTWKRQRACDDPAPQHGGSTCQGSAEQSTSCNTGVECSNGGGGGGGGGGGNNDHSRHLHKMTRTTLGVQECGEIVAVERLRHLCTRNVPESTGVCGNAQGAPLVCMKDGAPYLAGVFSYGDVTCQNQSPEVFTQLGPYYGSFIKNGLK